MIVTTRMLVVKQRNNAVWTYAVKVTSQHMAAYGASLLHIL